MTTLCRQICREGGLHVLSVDYRLAPEHKAPASVDDAFTAFKWALDHAAELGADPERVAVGGDSAGGNLAALVSLRARDEGVRLPAVQLLFYPVTDWGAQTRSRTLFGDGFFLTGGDLQFGAREVPRRRGRRRDRPAGIAAAGRRPVRTTACAGADGRFRPASRRRQAVRGRSARGGRARSTTESSGR